MGEAKRRRQAEWAFAQQQFNDELDILGAPPIEGEADLYREVSSLPELAVPRAPLDRIAWMRMEPNHCHVNAWAYCNKDPTQLSEMVTGWWCQTPIFRLHSVVRRQGNVFCVTPSPVEMLRFRPDPLIARRDDAGFERREVIMLPPVLRPDPEATIEAVADARVLLATGTVFTELPPALLIELGCALDAGQWVKAGH